MADDRPRRPRRGNRCGVLHDHQISHGDLRDKEITVDDGTVLFGGFGNAEYGATDAQLQSDIAQLLVTTTELYGAEAAVRRGDRRLRQGRRPDGVAATHEIGCAVADPQVGGRRRRRDVRRARRSQAADRRRSDQGRDHHPVHPQPDHPAGAAGRTGLRRLPVHQPRCPRSSPNCERRTGGGRCSGWRCRR